MESKAMMNRGMMQQRGHTDDVRCASYPIREESIQDSGHSPIWEQWRKANLPRRMCGSGLHLQHREYRQLHKVVPYYCGTWACARCGPRLKAQWLEHLEGVVSSAMIEGQALHLSVMSVDVSWHMVSTRLRRAGAQYVRLKVGDEYVVLHTEAIQGSTRIPQGMALGVLKAAIGAVEYEARPISTSAGWRLAKEEPVESEWERVSIVAMSVEVSRDLLEHQGYDVMPTGEGYMIKVGEGGFDRLVYWLSGKWARECYDR